jgi:hypothetical protein
MRIHVGCELSFDFPETMPMIATLNVHFSRFSDLERPDHSSICHCALRPTPHIVSYRQAVVCPSVQFYADIDWPTQSLRLQASWALDGKPGSGDTL